MLLVLALTPDGSGRKTRSNYSYLTNIQQKAKHPVVFAVGQSRQQYALGRHCCDQPEGQQVFSFFEARCPAHFPLTLEALQFYARGQRYSQCGVVKYKEHEMKELKILLASMALTCSALFPAVSSANDELDVTMDIFEDLADIDDDIATMRGPGDHDDDFGDDEHSGEDFDGEGFDAESDEDSDAEEGERDHRFDNIDGSNEFENDEDFDEQDEHDLAEEDDFEHDEGEDVDDDIDDDMDSDDEHDDDLDNEMDGDDSSDEGSDDSV